MLVDEAICIFTALELRILLLAQQNKGKLSYTQQELSSILRSDTSRVGKSLRKLEKVKAISYKRDYKAGGGIIESKVILTLK